MEILKRMESKTKKQLTVAASLLAIGASMFWMYQQYTEPNPSDFLHQEIGKVMAEETSRLLNHKGRIEVVAIDTPRAPELKIQLKSFEENLQKLGSVKIAKTEILDTKGQPKYRTGGGLSASRFLRILKKGERYDAIVSFVGAPNLSDEECAQVGEKRPKFIAESLSVDNLGKLFQTNILDIAIVGRFQFPSPVIKPKTPRDSFNKRFQILNSANAKALAE